MWYLLCVISDYVNWIYTVTIFFTNELWSKNNRQSQNQRNHINLRRSFHVNFDFFWYYRSSDSTRNTIEKNVFSSFVYYRWLPFFVGTYEVTQFKNFPIQKFKKDLFLLPYTFLVSFSKQVHSRNEEIVSIILMIQEWCQFCVSHHLCTCIKRTSKAICNLITQLRTLKLVLYSQD